MTSKHRFGLGVSIIASIGLLGLTCHHAAAAVSVRKVIMNGEPVPGTPTGTLFSSFRSFAMNEHGRVAFSAETYNQPTGQAFNSGIWSEGTGDLHLVALKGANTEFETFNPERSTIVEFVINDAGQTAFYSAESDWGTYNDLTKNGSIWIETGGTLNRIASEGDTLYSAPYAEIESLDAYVPVLNTHGVTAFLGTLKDTGGGTVDESNDVGIFRAYSIFQNVVEVDLVAIEGQPAPGTGPDISFSSFISPLKRYRIAAGMTPRTPISLNDHHQTVFWASLTGPGVDLTNDTGIWSNRSGSLELVARAGDPAPGAGTGVYFSKMGTFNGFFHEDTPVINNTGDIVFTATLAGPGVDQHNERSIWLSNDNGLELVMSERDSLPGTNPGEVPSIAYSNDQLISENGDVVFRVDLRDPIDFHHIGGGVWRWRDGTTSLIVRNGDQIPGLQPGLVFASNSYRPKINGLGQIAFSSSILDSSSGTIVGAGVWVSDPYDSPTLIVQTGDLIDVNDSPLIDDLREITSLGLGGYYDGFQEAFNDAGQLAIRLSFSDGSSGIFVATIPEPGALTLLVMGICGCLRNRV